MILCVWAEFGVGDEGTKVHIYQKKTGMASNGDGSTSQNPNGEKEAIKNEFMIQCQFETSEKAQEFVEIFSKALGELSWSERASK
jgi:hypothetical protein